MKIAICDDSSNDIEMLRQYILKHSTSHKICEFTSPAPFIDRILANEQFDLLFLDIQMPDANGWEIAKELKLTRCPVYIVLVTILGEYIYDCFDRVDWFLPKPFSQERIFMILEKAQEKLYPKVFTFESEHIKEAQSPVFPRLKRSRCRSSQEVNDSPTPFSALNYC